MGDEYSKNTLLTAKKRIEIVIKCDSILIQLVIYCCNTIVQVIVDMIRVFLVVHCQYECEREMNQTGVEESSSSYITWIVFLYLSIECPGEVCKWSVYSC